MYEIIHIPGFVCFSHSSSVVDPVISSHMRPCGHFTGWTKDNNKTNKGWKKEREKHRFSTAKCRKVKLVLLTFSVCMYGYCKNSVKILHSYQRCWLIWSLTSPLNVFVLDSIPPSDCSDPMSWALNVWFSALESHPWLTNIYCLFFWSHRFMQWPLFVWFLCQNRQRKVF